MRSHVLKQSGAALHQVFFCQFLHCNPLVANLHWGGLQIHDLHWGSHGQYINSAHFFIPAHGGGDYCCYCGLYQWHQGCTGLRNIYGDRGFPSGVSLAVRHPAISWNPGGSPFGLAPLLSLSWGISSGEPLDEVDLETFPRSHHSSSKRHQALLCHLELQLWCCQGSPGL